MLLLWSLWLLSGEARAACQVTQRELASDHGPAVEIEVEARGSPDGCRTVRLRPEGGGAARLQGWWFTPAGSRYRLPRDHAALTDGGVFQVIAPELVSGGRLLLRVAWEGAEETGAGAPALTVALGEVPMPTPESALLRRDSRRALILDPAHPGWGFADPARGRTVATDAWTMLPDAAPERFPLPIPVEVMSVAGLTVGPGYVRTDADQARLAWEQPGAAPQAILDLPPGSLELIGQDVAWVFTAPPGAVRTDLPGGVRWELPSGGQLRYRVERAGADGVIPDAATWIAGLTERFRVRSLPEPAVPMALRGHPDPAFVRSALYALCRDLIALSAPGLDALHPRPLNRAWRGGWASPVERALILQRLLAQERLPSRWVLTGADPDLATLTGFDQMLLQTPEGWLDPGCRSCVPGEIRPALSGRISLDARAEPGVIPPLPGAFRRDISLHGERFEVSVEASGQAAVWLREPGWGDDPSRREARARAQLGVGSAELLSAEGMDERGAPVRLRYRTLEPPGPIQTEGRWAEPGASQAPGAATPE